MPSRPGPPEGASEAQGIFPEFVTAPGGAAGGLAGFAPGVPRESWTSRARRSASSRALPFVVYFAFCRKADFMTSSENPAGTFPWAAYR